MLSYQRVCAYHEGFCMQNCTDSQICLHVLYILSYCRLVSCSVHGSVLYYYSMLCRIVLFVLSCDVYCRVMWFLNMYDMSWNGCMDLRAWHVSIFLFQGCLHEIITARREWSAVSFKRDTAAPIEGWQTQKAMTTKYFGSKFIISITPRFSLLKFCKWRSTKRFII